MEKTEQMRSEMFVSLVEKVDQLPVALVIGTLIPVYGRGGVPIPEDELTSLGYGNYYALCPFHADEKLGSFVITPSKNMWWCFTEKIGWRGIHFEMGFFELGFKDAVLHLARRFGLVTEDEYARYGRRKIDESLVKSIEKSMEKPEAVPQQKKADPDVIRSVYNIIPKVCELKEADRKHLRRERGLHDEDLADYFTFPTRKFDLAGHVYRKAGEEIAMKNFGKNTRSLSREEAEKMSRFSNLRRLRDQLPSVPGFYMDDRKKRIDFASYKGIGFVVRDENGHPLGIQIRRNTVKEGESRYVWFSSAFAQAKDGCSGGSSSGSPGGVIMPKDPDRAAICITEGRFKAEHIAKKGNIAVYVSGVSTWKNVLPMIDRIKGSRKKAYLMFDADMMGNTAVHAQLAEVAEVIGRHGLAPYVILWPIERGKGFDDLVLRNGEEYRKLIKSMSFRKFEKIYSDALRDTLASFGAGRVRDIKTAQMRSLFNKKMQEAVEENAGLVEKKGGNNEEEVCFG